MADAGNIVSEAEVEERLGYVVSQFAAAREALEQSELTIAENADGSVIDLGALTALGNTAVQEMTAGVRRCEEVSEAMRALFATELQETSEMADRCNSAIEESSAATRELFERMAAIGMDSEATIRGGVENWLRRSQLAAEWSNSHRTAFHDETTGIIESVQGNVDQLDTETRGEMDARHLAMAAALDELSQLTADYQRLSDENTAVATQLGEVVDRIRGVLLTDMRTTMTERMPAVVEREVKETTRELIETVVNGIIQEAINEAVQALAHAGLAATVTGTITPALPKLLVAKKLTDSILAVMDKFDNLF